MKVLISLFMLLFTMPGCPVGFAQAVAEKPLPDSLAFRQVNTSLEYFRKLKPELAIGELKKAYKIFVSANDSTGLSVIHNCLGNYYSANGLFEQAIEEYEYAILFNKFSDTISRSALLSNLADAILRTGNPNEALRIDSISINLIKATRISGTLPGLYLHIARIFTHQKRFAEAEKLLLKRVLPLYSSAGNSIGRMESFDCLAKGYYLRSRYSEAKWFYIQENMLARERNYPVAVVQSLIGLGMVKSAIKDYKLALNDFQEAEKLSLRHQKLPQLSTTYYHLASLYRITGEISKSKNALSKFNHWTKVLNSSKAKDAQTALKLKADFDKASAELLAKPKKLNKEPKSESNSTIILIMLLALIFLISGILIFKKKSPKSRK